MLCCGFIKRWIILATHGFVKQHTKQNAPDSSNHGTLRRSVLPRKLFSTTLLPVWIRAMTGRNANLVTESRWRIQAAKLHPKDSDSEIGLLDFQNPNKYCRRQGEGTRSPM